MNDRFVSFFLFDSHFNEVDQSPGDIIYSISKDEQFNQDADLKYIATGVITTINAFCRLFGEEYCDYMITNNLENAFLPIGEDLYFFVSLKLPRKQTIPSHLATQMMSNINPIFHLHPDHLCASNTRKTILKNKLIMIKKVLFLSIQQPKRNSNGKISDKFKNDVNIYLPKILDLINWNTLSYTQIWRESVFIAKLPKMLNIEFLDELRTIQNQNQFIHGLILTNKNKVIAYTTDKDLANILNFLVKKKYNVYYPYKLKKKKDILHYVIGIINHENGLMNDKKDSDDFMSVITPPLFWNDQTFALIALKFNMAKLIAIIDLSIVDLETDLSHFKTTAEPLLRKCDMFNNENNAEFEELKEDLDSRFKKNPGAKLSCNFKLNTIQILANRVPPNEMDLIIHGILFSNEINMFIEKELMKTSNFRFKYNQNEIEMNYINDNDNESPNTECLIPFYSGFCLYFTKKENKYSNMYMKIKNKKIVNVLELFQKTNKII